MRSADRRLLEQQLATALTLHQQGRVADACIIYTEILKKDPSHGSAMHFLGLAHHQQGNSPAAEPLMRESIRLHPLNPDFLANFGAVLHALGKLDEAITTFQRALHLRPDFPAAINNLSRTLIDQHRSPEAIILLRKTLVNTPKIPELHYNLGRAFFDAGDNDEAEKALQTALQLRPDYSDALMELGTVLASKNRPDEGVELCRRSAQLAPHTPEPLRKIAKILRTAHRIPEADAAYKSLLAQFPDDLQSEVQYTHFLITTQKFEAAGEICENRLQIDPDSVPTLIARGLIRARQNQQQPAFDDFDHALKLDPQNFSAHMNKAVALDIFGMNDESITQYERALQIAPGYSVLEWNKSLLLLRKGEFTKGWELYKSRWRMPSLGYRRSLKNVPVWKGEPLDGKVFLVSCEQGHGDFFQFVRFAALLADRGATVFAHCDKVVQEILATAPGISGAYSEAKNLPPVDYQQSVLDLPGLFNTTLDSLSTLPQPPYLHPTDAVLEKWRLLIGPAKKKLRVGIAWQGAHTHANDSQRSIAPSHFAQLATLPDIEWFSLQKGKAVPLPAALEAVDFMPQSDTFLDTAALISHLDLVISVDTSVCHLAGALNQRTWTLLPRVSDFRWLMDRADSPWYPAMKLYRQPAIGDWQSVIDKLLADLKSLLSQK